jgi:hypothetical protein
MTRIWITAVVALAAALPVRAQQQPVELDISANLVIADDDGDRWKYSGGGTVTFNGNHTHDVLFSTGCYTWEAYVGHPMYWPLFLLPDPGEVTLQLSLDQVDGVIYRAVPVDREALALQTDHYSQPVRHVITGALTGYRTYRSSWDLLYYSVPSYPESVLHQTFQFFVVQECTATTLDKDSGLSSCASWANTPYRIEVEYQYMETEGLLTPLD